MAVGPDDRVYMLWRLALTEYQYLMTITAEYAKSIGKEGNRDGEFIKPHAYAIAVSDNGHVYVSDTDNNQV